MAREEKPWPGMMELLELLASMQGAMRARNNDPPNRGARFIIPRLAGREAEILRMIEEKQTKAKMAERLGVTRQTLRNHLERMGAK